MRPPALMPLPPLPPSAPPLPACAPVPIEGKDSNAEPPPPGRGADHQGRGEEPASLRPPVLMPFNRAGRQPEGPMDWGFGDAARQVRVWRVR